jgi:hypothetical protein
MRGLSRMLCFLTTAVLARGLGTFTSIESMILVGVLGVVSYFGWED